MADIETIYARRDAGGVSWGGLLLVLGKLMSCRLSSAKARRGLEGVRPIDLLSSLEPWPASLVGSHRPIALANWRTARTQSPPERSRRLLCPVWLCLVRYEHGGNSAGTTDQRQLPLQTSTAQLAWNWYFEWIVVNRHVKVAASLVYATP